jgi:spore germination cell wall hydrolase CwlJ-like protein
MPKLLVSAVLLLSCSTMHMPDNTNALVDSYRCMVENVWHEARGEGIRGMHAVALVTMNRAKQRNKTVCEIVYEPRQFSWTVNVTSDMLDNIDDVRKAAADVMTDNVRDFTNGATHYHASYSNPLWTNSMQRVAVVGKHQFYRKQ